MNSGHVSTGGLSMISLLFWTPVMVHWRFWDPWMSYILRCILRWRVRMIDSCLLWTYESGTKRMYSRQRSTGNRPSPVCTRGGTVMVPLAKRSPLFAHLCNAHGRSARRSISIVRWRRRNQFLRRMATLDRLSAALYSRPWKASRCALVNKVKWIRCSYVFPGLAPSQLLLGIGSTGLQLKLFPTARRSALLRPADYSTRARKTYFQQKVE